MESRQDTCPSFLARHFCILVLFSTDVRRRPPTMSSNNAASVYGAAGVMFVFSTAAVILRFVARSRVKAGLWWDDWIILAALVCHSCVIFLFSPSRTLTQKAANILCLDIADSSQCSVMGALLADEVSRPSHSADSVFEGDRNPDSYAFAPAQSL